MKKHIFIAALSAGIVLTSSTPIYADSSRKNALSDVGKATMEAFLADDIKYCNFGDQVNIVDVASFTVDGWNFYKTDTEKPGTIEVCMAVTVENNMDDYTFALLEYDFALIAESENTASGYDVYWPTCVLENTAPDYREVEFDYEVADSTSLLYYFEVPASTTEVNFVLPNMAYNKEGVLESVGPCIDYGVYRTPMDFVLENNTGKSIQELYVVPESADTWQQNILDNYVEKQLKVDKWLDVVFYDTEYSDCDDEEWGMKIVFEDGEDIFLNGLNLREIFYLIIHETEDGAECDYEIGYLD